MGLRIPKVEKKLMVKIIKENLEKNDAQIAELMRAAKLTAPSGKEIDNRFVCNLRNNSGIRKRRPVKRAQESKTQRDKSVPSSNQDERALIDLVVTSKLTKDQKVRIIEALL